MLLPDLSHLSDFIIGADDFKDLEVAKTGENGFHYFKHRGKGLIKRFVLKRTALSEKVCFVTLIKLEGGAFEPRLDFEIRDLTKGAVAQAELPVAEGEARQVKAKVDLGDCHENASRLIRFICEFDGVELAGDSFAVVANEERALAEALKSVDQKTAVAEFAQRFAGTVSEGDLALIAGRKASLEEFRLLLTDDAHFERRRTGGDAARRREDVWQDFFEKNTWIFGYGLQLVSCEALDNRKLETIVVGSDVVGGAGKRTDALMKTRGRISRALFGEIKTHKTRLTEKYDRPGVYVPSKDLQGAIGQVQKTVHKVGLKMSENFKRIADPDGVPSGETIGFVRPRSVIVVGRLDEFNDERGLLNEERFASFELYRQQLVGIEILTFDELYERTRYIVEDNAAV